MKFKLIRALVTDDKTDTVTEAARRGGATGCTVITSARGEGLAPAKTFLGLTLEGQSDAILFLVERQVCYRGKRTKPAAKQTSGRGSRLRAAIRLPTYTRRTAIGKSGDVPLDVEKLR